MTAFLANENIPKASVELLRNRGFDVAWIAADSPSIKDEAIMARAESENRIIITMDRDYGELVFLRQLKRPKGVIFLRLEEFAASDQASLIIQYLEISPDIFETKFSVITRNRLRQRPL